MERVRRIETWARLGFLARGIVYLVLGWLALSSNRALSTGESVAAVRELPAGTALLALLVFGLFGYGLFKLYEGAVDLEGDGDDTKGRVKRAARMIGGLGYFALAFLALRQLGGGASGGGDSERQVAREVAQSSGGGDMLLVLAGIIALVVAATQLAVAARAKFMDGMAGAPAFVKPAGQAGYAARALVIALVGWSVLQAGLSGARLRTSADVLAMLRDDSPLIFKLVAAGLALFGLTSLVMARYRRIADDDVVARLSGAVRSAAAR